MPRNPLEHADMMQMPAYLYTKKKPATFTDLLRNVKITSTNLRKNLNLAIKLLHKNSTVNVRQFIFFASTLHAFKGKNRVNIP